MTRIAIVAASEALRSALASALATSPAFEIVGVSASGDEAPESAEVVLMARTQRASNRAVRAATHDVLGTAAAADPPLSHREREILALLADGLGNKQIAARLDISVNTVKTHVEMLFDKLGASSRAEAVAIGVRRGALLL